MTKTRVQIQADHAAACKYPHTSPDMFESATLVRIGNNEILKDDNAHRALIETSAISCQLQNTNIALPTYNIGLPGGAPLQDRIAILGIGSNCSPHVLLKKFQKAGIGGDFYMAQATLNQHAIAHSAFIGAQAYMPATVLPEENSQSFVTVGFYTPEQAEALTGTEPNYDLVQKSRAIITRDLANNPTLEHGALLYISIWGAFTEDGITPALQDGIPQVSPHKTHPTIWTAGKAAEITGYGTDVIRFAEAIKPGVENLQTRLEHTFKLHPQNAIAATIEGTQVKKATLYKQAEALPVPMLPRITYL